MHEIRRGGKSTPFIWRAGAADHWCRRDCCLLDRPTSYRILQFDLTWKF